MTLIFVSCTKDSPTYTTDTSSSIVGTSKVNAKVATDIIFNETANYLSATSLYVIKVTSTLNASIKYKTSVTASPIATFYPLVLNTYSTITGGVGAIGTTDAVTGFTKVDQTSKYIRFNLKYNSTVVGTDTVVFSVKDATGKVIEKTIQVVVTP